MCHYPTGRKDSRSPGPVEEILRTHGRGPGLFPLDLLGNISLVLLLDGGNPKGKTEKTKGVGKEGRWTKEVVCESIVGDTSEKVFLGTINRSYVGRNK